MARGGRTGAWSAKTNDKGQWIQVNLGKMKEITKIGLQGRQDYSQWVTKYKVSYSKDGQNFTLQNQVGDDLHKLMHSSIPAVPIPPGNRGAFAHVVSPGD